VHIVAFGLAVSKSDFVSPWNYSRIHFICRRYYLTTLFWLFHNISKFKIPAVSLLAHILNLHHNHMASEANRKVVSGQGRLYWSMLINHVTFRSSAHCWGSWNTSAYLLHFSMDVSLYCWICRVFIPVNFYITLYHSRSANKFPQNHELKLTQTTQFVLSILFTLRLILCVASFGWC